MNTKTTLLRLARGLQAALDSLYRAPVVPGSALDQEGLRNGLEVVSDYLEHNEQGLAFEHLLYMIIEPDLAIAAADLDEVAAVGRRLGFAESLWAQIRTV